MSLPILRRLFLLIVLGPALAYAALPSGVTQGPTVEGVTQYGLANGLSVLLFPDASKPTTTVNVTYLVGSRQESYGETGMAHLLEHMLFKGSPSIPNIFQELGRRGMRFNGSTFYDRTNYYETFTASDESLDWALRMEAERMTRSTFTKAELDTEMTVVRNEFENWENNPRLVLWGRMQAVAFDWHNYGNLTIGARADIENVPFEKLRAFYRTYYQPDNAILIVAGKFDPDATLALIAKYFGPIPKPPRAPAAPYTVEPVQDGERSVTVRRVGGAQFVGALFHTPPGAHPDGTAVEALGEIMTIAPAGRLYQALVETKQATAVESWSFNLHDPGMVIFWAQVALGDSIDAARDTLLKTLYAVRERPITEAEVDRVRARQQKLIDETINDPQKFAVAMSEVVTQGDWRLFFLQRDRWRALKAADVERVALAYLKPANLTLGRFLPDAKPERAPEPQALDVAAMVKDYKGDAAVSAGEVFDPTPANLEARTRRYTLPNGMKVALLPKKTRGETVQLSLQLDLGDTESLRNTAPAGALAAAMLKSGTNKRDCQAFEDALDAARAKLEFGGDETRLLAQGETVRAKLPDLLRLAAEALRDPAFLPSEYAKHVREQLATLEEGRTEPQAITTRALERHDNPYPKGDVRYPPTLDEEIAAVKALPLERVREFHTRFYGASNAEIALVGDFDADAVRALLTELFGDWKSASPYARVPDPYRATKPAALAFETPDKANAFLLGEIALPLNDLARDFAAVNIVNRLLGGGPEARLPHRIRETDGLSYDVATQVQPAFIDENSTLYFVAIFAPQNLAKVRAAVASELDRAVKDGFGADEVEAAKRAVLQARQIARAQDRTVAAGLVRQAFLGRTWDEAAKLDAAIAAVTPEQATAALHKYVRPASIAWAFAGDFAKK